MDMKSYQSYKRHAPSLNVVRVTCTIFFPKEQNSAPPGEKHNMGRNLAGKSKSQTAVWGVETVIYDSAKPNTCLFKIKATGLLWRSRDAVWENSRSFSIMIFPKEGTNA